MTTHKAVVPYWLIHMEDHNKIVARNKRYRENNRLKLRERSRAYRKKYPEKIRASDRKYHLTQRLRVLRYYSENDIKCACCGERELKFLALDHRDGNGSKHRRDTNAKGNQMYAWIIKNNFPPIFQVLCHNCNLAKGFYGSCPHNIKRWWR